MIPVPKRKKKLYTLLLRFREQTLKQKRCTAVCRRYMTCGMTYIYIYICIREIIIASIFLFEKTHENFHWRIALFVRDYKYIYSTEES